VSRRHAGLLAVHSALIGGAQLRALAEAEHLMARWRLVLAVRHGPLHGAFAACGTTVRGSPVLPLGGGSDRRWALQLGRSLADAARIAALVRRHDAAWVMTSSSVLLGPVLGARLAGVPALVRMRELPLDGRAARAQRLLGELADVVLPVSDSAARGAGPRAHVVVLADGVRIPASPAPVRRTGTGPVRLILVGMLTAERVKGQDLAIRALGELVRSGLDARLELAGEIRDQEFAAACRALAVAEGVADRVTFRGRVVDVPGAIIASDLVLSCSRSEGLGMSVMEGLALGRPVVATAVGGIREVIRDGETGVLAVPEDPRAIAEAVRRVVADPEGARRMGLAGRADVAARYDERTALAALDDAVERAVARRSRPGTTFPATRRTSPKAEGSKRRSVAV
jgi:glycosyltransferase involved in cell wall biosynthesis